MELKFKVGENIRAGDILCIDKRGKFRTMIMKGRRKKFKAAIISPKDYKKGDNLSIFI